MSELNNISGNFREAVSVEVQRIFDTCSQRDCISDLPVTLDCSEALSSKISIIKTRSADVSGVCTSIEKLPFKCGYYSADITFTFTLRMEAYEAACTEECIPLTGTAVWNKRVILYGGSGDIKTFTSEAPPQGKSSDISICRISSRPRVSVSTVPPIALDTRFECDRIISVPECDTAAARRIYVTLGLFSVIQLTRPVSLLIPAYDYCIPEKENGCSCESPGQIFDRLDFPAEQFFPQAAPVNEEKGSFPPEDDISDMK